MNLKNLCRGEMVVMPKDCCSGGKVCEISKIDRDSFGEIIRLEWYVLNPKTYEREGTDYCTGHASLFQDIIYYKDAPKKHNGGIINYMSSLLDKAKMLVLSEPEKTFRKLGILDSCGELTTEGKALYEAWKFKKDQDAFKLEVADPLLKEMEDEKVNCKN